jgi:hypothetical protein
MNKKYFIGLLAVFLFAIAINMFDDKHKMPSLSMMGLASLEDFDVKHVSSSETHTYIFYSSIDELVRWLINCDSFHPFENGSRKSSDYYKSIIISDLNFKAGSLLIDKVIQSSGDLHSVYVKCEYADETKDNEKLIIFIEIHE